MAAKDLDNYYAHDYGVIYENAHHLSLIKVYKRPLIIRMHGQGS